MLRDIVAVCAIQAWTTTELEDLMLTMRGLQHKTTYQMILELERSLCLEGITEARGAYYRTTDHGVIVFLLSRESIPASIAWAAVTFSDARKSEINSGV